MCSKGVSLNKQYIEIFGVSISAIFDLMRFFKPKDFSEEEILYVCTSNTYVFI